MPGGEARSLLVETSLLSCPRRVPTAHVPVLFSIRAHDSRFLYLHRTRSSLVFNCPGSIRNQKTTYVATIVCMALLVTVPPRHVLQTPSPRVHLAFHDSLISHIWEARSSDRTKKSSSMISMRGQLMLCSKKGRDREQLWPMSLHHCLLHAAQ
jgi:hypothetical protein